MFKGYRTGLTLPDDVRESVLQRVAPDERERKKVAATAEALKARASEVLTDLGHNDVEALLAGSVAKGTFSKDPDIDLFLIFPEDTPQDVMERVGLDVGTRVLADPKKKYTQHPYITGRFQGAVCDIVPCMRIGPGDRVRTAVDRTPLHSEYINSKLDRKQRSEVLLLKSFLKGIGAYGAEDTVNGFSGYLAELLIIRYRDLEGVGSALSGLEPLAFPNPAAEELGRDFGPKGGPVIIEVEGGKEKEGDRDRRNDLIKRFDQASFIVPDPVDDRRNVASPVSPQTLSLTIRAFRELSTSPTKDMFHPFSRRPRSLGARSKGDAVGLFTLPLPEGNPGIITTQLRSALNRCLANLIRKGFENASASLLLVFPSGSDIDQSYLRARYIWTSQRVKGPAAIVRLVTEPERLPEEYVHWGPPADNPRAADFRARWKERTAFDQKSGKLCVTLRREETDAARSFIDAWRGMVLPSHFTGFEIEDVGSGSPPSAFSSVMLPGPLNDGTSAHPGQY